ncbi:MAG: F0F1 ATP synthase subunit epsilon [Candidatus Margulisiibacteriota bacterium]
MRESFELEIITPYKVALKKEVTYVRVPGTEGNIGIYPNHSPLLTCLDSGAVIYEHVIEEEKMEPLFVTGGFIEILPDKVTVLADIVEWKSAIDLERAKKAKQRAEERLQAKEEGLDLLRAEAALKRAIYRIMVKEGTF